MYKTFSSPYPHQLLHKHPPKFSILRPKDEEFDVFSGSVLILFVQTAVLPTKVNIVDKTCSRTPHPSVCLSSLKSNPRSAQADIYGLAVIMIDVVKAKSTATLNKINQLLKQSPGDKSLKDCAESYTAIVEYFPTVYQAIKLGRAMFALEGMNNAERTHPLTKFNKDVADVASVAAAIINEFP